MTIAPTAVAAIQFQGWEIRPEERALLVAGTPVQVGGRAFELLLALVERRGRVVSKGELLEAAWRGLVVEENNISVQIAALRKVLGPRAIATIPGRGYQLSATPIVAAAAPSDPKMTAVPAGVDMRAELFGRQQDVAEVLEILRTAPLLTLVGTGGVGKTSLAREVFAQQCALHRQAGCWIDLAPIRESRQLLAFLAKSLDIDLQEVPDQAELLALALSHMAAFVVLDNCEHLLDDLAAFVSLAMKKAPGIRWLATSQEHLRVPNERVYRLESLAVPMDRMSPAKALEFGSIALLCKRIVEADRSFRLDESNLEAAIVLCSQLDGLPLAIELAAARAATFGLEDVCRRLQQRQNLLTASSKRVAYRHGTLQGTYEWSCSLLSEREQVVFRRLEPFLGGFRPDMVQEVAGDAADGGFIDSSETLNVLGALVDKSLVQRSADDAGRFFLLESARDYARTCLHAARETAAVRTRHARTVAGWFAHAQADADRMTDAQWLRIYAPERHNARAALAWACGERAADDCAQLVTALSMMDWFLCRQAEIIECDVPLELLERAAPRLRAEAYLELSWAHYCDGNHDLGARLAQEACDLFSALGDNARAYRALAQLTRLHESRPGMSHEAQAAWARLQQFDDRQVSLRTRLFCSISAGLVNRADEIERLQELGRLAESMGFDAIAAICGCNLTNKLLIAGRNAEVVTAAERLLASGIHLPRAIAFILHNKAAALIQLGCVDDAREAARLAFQAMPAVAYFLVDSFALAAAREGHFADAAVLHGCGSRIRQDKSHQPDTSESAAIAETAARLEREMSPLQRTELMKLGSTMTASEALDIKVFAREPRGLATDASPAAARDPLSSLGVS